MFLGGTELQWALVFMTRCRLVTGVEILARMLHPDLVSKAAPGDAVLKLSLQGGQRCRPHMVQKYFKPYH